MACEALPVITSKSSEAGKEKEGTEGGVRREESGKGEVKMRKEIGM